MTILVVAALPLAAAMLVLALRRARRVAGALTMVALVGTAILALGHVGETPFHVLGRPLYLTEAAGFSLAVAALLMATPFATRREERSSGAVCSVTLCAFGFFAGAAVMGNWTIGAILLTLGALFSVLLIPLQRNTRAKHGMQGMFVTMLLAPFLLMAASALDPDAGAGAGLLSPQDGSVFLVVALAVGLGAFPFHGWLTREFREGTEETIIMLTVVVGLGVLGVASNMVDYGVISPRPERVAAVLMAAGSASALLGGLGALGKRAFSDIVAYSAVADLGVVLMGLALSAQSQPGVATLHAWYRGLAITGCALALGVFRRCLGGDEEHHVRGAMQRAPLTLIGAALAGLSLSGLPLTAGFTTRLAVYGSLAQVGPGWVITVAIASLGPVWSMWRWLRPALAPLQYPGESREPRGVAILILLIGIVLLVLGMAPGLVALLPLGWPGVGLTALFA